MKRARSALGPPAPLEVVGGDALPAADAARNPRRITPHLIGYAMGPLALVVILLLRRLHVVAHEPLWLWLAVFAAIPATSAVADLAYRRRPTPKRLHARMACHVAAVTVVIYLSGWGPVLVLTFAFVALENIAHDGSRAWRPALAWSLAGVVVGQICIWVGWLPSFLRPSHAQALEVMGCFVLIFVVRMAGAAAEKQEDAEALLRASEERFRSLVQHSSDTTLVIGEGRAVTYASPATRALLGIEPEDLVGRDPLEFAHPDERERVRLQLGARLQGDATGEPVEFRMKHSDGTWRHVEAVLSDLRDRPSIAGYVANLRDTTERKQAENLLAHQALHDPLTGLANRTLLHDRAEQMLVRSRRAYQPVAALFIDVDNFKEINDTLGHEAGDDLLQAIAERFTVAARASDTLARLGGDEFVIIAEGLSPETGPEQLAQRLLELLRQPFNVARARGGTLSITASIGIAVGVRTSAQELLRDADIALYRAKAAGKNCWVMFEPGMQSAVLDRLVLKQDLCGALERDEFFVLYQPLFDLETKTMYGVEALLRWNHPTRGVVGPDSFIFMLEETGQIVEVGRWVLDRACYEAAKWARGGHPVTMSVNISMRQFETSTLLDDVRGALSTHQLAPRSLLIEITESALMHDAEATIAQLEDLKRLGVQVAIDDFGTGYSSLSYLRHFPVDALKIDRSFVAAMPDSPEAATLIRTMVELGSALGLRTIAEGIEHNFQLDHLLREGCERGQGFLFSRPVTPEAIDAILAGDSPADVAALVDEAPAPSPARA